MESTPCKRCGQVIEGFSPKDIKHRMLMHSMKHRKEEEKEEKKKEAIKNGNSTPN